MNGPAQFGRRTAARAAGVVVATAVALTTILPLRSAAQSQVAGVRIEYVAHASFIVQSPTGTRVAIDPYNSHLWMGYVYPRDLAADAVLISHPHFDHDAAYYFPGDVPVFRDAGRYVVGDVRITGIKGRHDGGASMVQRGQSDQNTMWLIEVGNVRILHTGDNGLFSASEVAEMGRVDILITGEAGHFRSAPPPNTGAVAVRPRVIIPMHYRHADLSPAETGLSPVDSIIRGTTAVMRVDSNVFVVNARTWPARQSAVVLNHSPRVQAWPDDVKQSLELNRRATIAARQTSPAAKDSARQMVREAIRLTPTLVAPYRTEALIALAAADTAHAVEMLERGLSRAPHDDTALLMQARAMLARLYVAQGQMALAAAQYAIIQRQERTSLRLREEARTFLAGRS